MCKFLLSCKNSSNAFMRYLFSHSCLSSVSNMGQNIVYIQKLYSTDLFLLLSSDVYPMCNVKKLHTSFLKRTLSEEDEATLCFCDELLQCRDNDTLSNFDNVECREMLNYVMTS